MKNTGSNFEVLFDLKRAKYCAIINFTLEKLFVVEWISKYNFSLPDRPLKFHLYLKNLPKCCATVKTQRCQSTDIKIFTEIMSIKMVAIPESRYQIKYCCRSVSFKYTATILTESCEIKILNSSSPLMNNH